MRWSSIRSLLRPSGRKVRVHALALSLALHGLLALLLFSGEPSQLLLLERPVEVEILAPPAEEQTEPPIEPPPEVRASAEPAAPAEPRPRRRSPAGSPPPSAGPDRPGDEATTPGRSTLRMRPGPAVDLSLSYGRVDRMTQEGVIAPPDPTGVVEDRPRKIPTFSQRLAARVRNDAARANVERGQVHPQMYDLLRDARRSFVPPTLALERDRRAPNTVGRTLKQWFGGILRPHTDAEDDRQQNPDRSRLGAPDVLDDRGRASLRAMGGYLGLSRGRASRIEPMDCVVCVVLRPHAEPEVTLGESSGNAELDNAAVDALKQATNTRTIEKDVPSQKSCYRFRATVERVPPVPVLGCGFDEVTMSARCFYPTQKIQKTTITLESVDYGG